MSTVFNVVFLIFFIVCYILLPIFWLTILIRSAIKEKKEMGMIPKEVCDILNDRVLHAEELNRANERLDEYLRKEGLYDKAFTEIEDSLTSGCQIYVDPQAAKFSVINFLEKELKDKEPNK